MLLCEIIFMYIFKMTKLEKEKNDELQNGNPKEPIAMSYKHSNESELYISVVSKFSQFQWICKMLITQKLMLIT